MRDALDDVQPVAPSVRVIPDGSTIGVELFMPFAESGSSQPGRPSCGGPGRSTTSLLVGTVSCKAPGRSPEMREAVSMSILYNKLSNWIHKVEKILIKL